LIPRVRGTRRVVLLKHNGDRLGVHLLRLREQTIRFGIVAHGLLVKSLLSEPAGLDCFIAFLLAIGHDTLPC
jgi:hypothetical protein